jgi:hypothetical protein
MPFATSCLSQNGLIVAERKRPGGSMRKKTIWSGMCATTMLVAAVTIGAQASSTSQPPPSQPQPPPSQTPQPPMTPPPQAPAAPAPQTRSENSNGRVTITGCLQALPPGTAGATSPTGTSGTADAKSDPGDVKFLLTNVTPADSAGSANAAAAAAARTYRLIANEAALSPHVGKKLELTGTLDDQSSSTSSASSASSDAAAASASSAPKLKVESGKVVAAQCSQ